MVELIEKAKPIRLMIFDVDGVLTNGKLFYTASGSEIKAFHVHDGQGIKFLQRTGITVAIITARTSEIISMRMRDLEIQHVYQNQNDKMLAYEELKQKLNLKDEQIAYAGDDLPDLPMIRRCGLGITVADAPLVMQQNADWTTKAKGGKGAAREICDFIMHAQNTYDTIVQSYVER